jgi:hypothetical protein
MKMITKISLAALALSCLALPASAQDNWAPWVVDAPAPVPQVRVAAAPQRVAAAQTVEVQSPAPSARSFRFEHFWVVGSFR